MPSLRYAIVRWMPFGWKAQQIFATRFILEWTSSVAISHLTIGAARAGWGVRAAIKTRAVMKIKTDFVSIFAVLVLQWTLILDSRGIVISWTLNQRFKVFPQTFFYQMDSRRFPWFFKQEILRPHEQAGQAWCIDTQPPTILAFYYWMASFLLNLAAKLYWDKVERIEGMYQYPHSYFDLTKLQIMMMMAVWETKIIGCNSSWNYSRRDRHLVGWCWLRWIWCWIWWWLWVGWCWIWWWRWWWWYWYWFTAQSQGSIEKFSIPLPFLSHCGTKCTMMMMRQGCHQNEGCHDQDHDQFWVHFFFRWVGFSIHELCVIGFLETVRRPVRLLIAVDDDDENDDNDPPPRPFFGSFYTPLMRLKEERLCKQKTPPTDIWCEVIHKHWLFDKD